MQRTKICEGAKCLWDEDTYCIEEKSLIKTMLFLFTLPCQNTDIRLSNLGGLGVTCSSRDPRFVGSNPAEVDRFFQDVKILSTSPRDFKLGVPSLRFHAR